MVQLPGDIGYRELYADGGAVALLLVLEQIRRFSFRGSLRTRYG
jgi:hypothetical protein